MKLTTSELNIVLCLLDLERRTHASSPSSNAFDFLHNPNALVNKAIRDFADSIEPEKQAEIAAIAYVGRGDRDPTESWQDIVDSVRHIHRPAHHVLAKASNVVSQYLRDGAKALQMAVDDLWSPPQPEPSKEKLGESLDD